MAEEWVKMRSGLDADLEVHHIARKCGISTDQVVARLYRVAWWFAHYGEYGVLSIKPTLIDSYLETHGFAETLIEVDWLRVVNGKCILRWFTNVSAKRKAIGKKLRSQVLSSGKCNLCGSRENLQVDHVVPVSKGGQTVPENPQPLCRACNIRKGAK